MRRRHIASYNGQQLTLCGHSATVQEFRRMKGFHMKDVTCKRCLKLHNKIMLKTDSMNHLRKEKPTKVPATA